MVTKNDIDERFRVNLIRLRNLRGLTQADLIERSGVLNLGQIESGARGAGKDAQARLATALEIDIAELYRPLHEELIRSEATMLRLFTSLPQAGRQFIIDVLKAFVKFERGS